MSSAAAVTYLRGQFAGHASRFFEESAAELLNSESIQFLPYSEATAIRRPQIAVAVDVPVAEDTDKSWQAQFNGTNVTLWNRLPNPDASRWQALPNDANPVWYRHPSGTLLPAWNLFGNTFDLLTFGEERRISQRDHHGRFAATFSPRYKRGLLEIPAVNETVALLAAALRGINASGMPAFELGLMLRPPVVVLSHDCDILLGNDAWTQAVRLYRTIAPVARARLPRPANLWWLGRNLVTPRRFYFDNATGMVDLERVFGYSSTYYLLNGTGGRFGARSPLTAIAQLAEQIPPRWDIGIHYNYDTFLRNERFEAQLQQLARITGRTPTAGRAHYLKFDPFQSFGFLRKFGIISDESSGYPDRIGYRNGLAGCFQPFDTRTQAPFDLWETPLVIMEAVLVEQYGSGAVEAVKRHLTHLSRIGGALTILVHPGQFFNPENSGMLGVYHEILKVCREAGAISQTASRLVSDRRALSTG